MKTMKRALSLIIVLSIVASVIAVSGIVASAVTPLGHLVQWETKWKSYYYGGGNLYNTGCGIFSLVNAVGYLTGQRMSITSTAQWAHSIGGYNVTGGEGTYRTVLYPKVQAKYGGTYGFTVDCNGGSGYWSTAASTKLKNHLAGGGVAVGHVPGHFIALVGYNSSNNTFHVYDSAPSTSRGTTSGNGNCWVTQSRLSTGKLDLDWFCLLSATSTEPEVVYTTGQYKMLGTKHLRDNASATYNTVVNVPAGEIMSVTKIVSGRYGYTQYGDFTGYIYLDEDVQYIGALDSKRYTTLTGDAVRYANADYTASWTDVTGASGYRYKVIQLEGDPDPGNINESTGATVLYDSTTYITQTLSVKIPAASMTNGKYLKVAVQTVFPDSSTWTTAYVTPSMLPFTDIPIESWMYDPALYCYENGLLNGTSASIFSPTDEVNMAMLVTVLHRAAGTPALAGTAEMPYTNISSTAYYYTPLLWCLEQNIIRVKELPEFDYTATVSREFAILCFYRLADRLEKNDKVIDSTALDIFSDTAEITDNCIVPLTWAVGKGLIHGSDGQLNPTDNTNRIQLATMLQNLDMFLGYTEAIYPALMKGDLDNNGTVEATDYLWLRTYLSGGTDMNPAFAEAADYNEDSSVSANDYIQLRLHIKNGKA